MCTHTKWGWWCSKPHACHTTPNVYNNISQNNVWFIYGGCWMWPWCVMMVLKVVTGRGKRTLKIYSPERPYSYRCWHICTSCNALQGVFRFVCAFIFPSPVMRIVDGLSWSWPYRSGNILTVGGLRNLKQILAGFQIPAASWPPPRPPALSGHIAPRPLSSTSHHQIPPPTFCGEIQTSVLVALDVPLTDANNERRLSQHQTCHP